MRLRRCQDDLIKLANKVVAKGIKVSTAHIVPGGGKSIGAMLFFQRLREMGLTHVAWIVPRVNLASQAEGETSRNANDPKYIDWGFQIEKLTDFGSPLTVYGGITTTIQSLCNPAKALVLEQQMKVAGQKWLLVIDECHHLEEGSDWTKAIQGVVDAADHVLLMSGVMERGPNSGPIAFLPRDESGDLLRDDKGHPKFDVTYTLSDALNQRDLAGEPCPALARAFFKTTRIFHQYDDSDSPGERCGVEFNGEGDHNPAALWSMLQDQEALEAIIDDALDERDKAAARGQKIGRLLAICGSMAVARRVRRILEQKTGERAALAISSPAEPDEDVLYKSSAREIAAGRKALEDFRDSGSPSMLVTVAMAYEGLDVPDLTDLIFLHRIRESWPWIDQAIHRVTRIVDAPGWPHPSKQEVRIQAPDDVAMVEYIANYREVQRLSDEENKPREPRGPGPDGPEDDEEKKRRIITPQGSKKIGEGMMDDDARRAVDESDRKTIQALADANQWTMSKAHEAFEGMRNAGLAVNPVNGAPDPRPDPGPVPDIERPSVKRTRLRKEISRLERSISRELGEDGAQQRRRHKRFNFKPIADISDPAKLEEILQWNLKCIQELVDS